MSRLQIVIIWFMVLVADGIILPALLGVPMGSGAVLFLIALIMTFGVRRWVVGFGIAAAFLSEIMFGIYFGSLIGPWLAIAWTWYGTNRFFSFKYSGNNDSRPALLPSILFGMALFAETQIIQWLLIWAIFDTSIDIRSTWEIISTPSILIVAVVELAILLVALRSVPAQRQFVYAD